MEINACSNYVKKYINIVFKNKNSFEKSVKNKQII